MTIAKSSLAAPSLEDWHSQISGYTHVPALSKQHVNEQQMVSEKQS